MTKQVVVYNSSGKKVGKINLPPIFSVKPNLSLVASAVANLSYNLRPIGGHTKTRGERRGGGRKPWRQKGTGRARVGSTRSPLWRKGGIIFGPRGLKPKRRKLGKSERKTALASILTQKLIDKEIIVIKKIELDVPKTKKMIEILSRLPIEDSVLIIIAKPDPKLELSVRNIPAISLAYANNLNLIDLIKYRYLIITEDAIKSIGKLYA
jgi:large subunit ribosomal protein L4